MKLFKKSLAIAAMAALMVPAGALASSSTDTYGGPGNVVSGLEQGSGGGNGTAPSTNTAPKQAAQGGLPFTGADLGVLAAAGGMLLGLGFGLRRLTHRPTEA
jgi:hypothetical protein